MVVCCGSPEQNNSCTNIRKFKLKTIHHELKIKHYMLVSNPSSSVHCIILVTFLNLAAFSSPVTDNCADMYKGLTISITLIFFPLYMQ